MMGFWIHTLQGGEVETTPGERRRLRIAFRGPRCFVSPPGPWKRPRRNEEREKRHKDTEEEGTNGTEIGNLKL